MSVPAGLAGGVSIVGLRTVLMSVIMIMAATAVAMAMAVSMAMGVHMLPVTMIVPTAG